MKLNGLTLIPLLLAGSYVLLCFVLGNLVIGGEAVTALRRHKQKRGESQKRIEAYLRDYFPTGDYFSTKGGEER